MSAQIKITVDGQVQQVAADQRPTHLFQDNAEIVVCKINGELKDLWSELSDGDVVESPMGLSKNYKFWHIIPILFYIFSLVNI